VTVQERERGRMRLGQKDCLHGEKEIRKESSDLSYLHNIRKVILFTIWKLPDRSLTPSIAGIESVSRFRDVVEQVGECVPL